MKEIKFNKKESNNQIIVDVELPERIWAKEPVLVFSNSDMIKYLNESGVKLEDYDLTSQTKNSLTSYADKENKPVLSGTWVFTKKEEKVNKSDSQPYKKKRVKKSGD